MEETLSIHCREKWGMGAGFSFLGYLCEKTIINTINITPIGIEVIPPNINQQSLFLWQNIQKIEYISYSNTLYFKGLLVSGLVSKQRYNEKISIQTKDKQTKTFVFALDTQYGKKQQPEHLIYDEPIYDKLHKDIYQILQHYTLKHQIHYQQTNTRDMDETTKINSSPLVEMLIFVLEMIISLLFTALLAVIIWFMIDRKELGLLVLAIPISIIWYFNTASLTKRIKQMKKK